MLLNCLEEVLRLYRPNARWGGEFEWPKTLQGPQLRIAENSWDSENLKRIVKQPLHHHMLFGRISRKTKKKQTPAYSVIRHDWNFKWDWLLWSDETKTELLAANTQDGFGEHRDKKYPMCTMKYTAVCFMLSAYISAGGPWTYCLDTWHHGFYQIPTDKT